MMATCKDCLHVEACKAIVTIINEATGLQINDDTETTIDADLECEYFTDRSRFVELPFGVGDTYFEIIYCFYDSKPCIIEFHIDKIVKLKNAYDELVDVFYEDKKAGRFSNALKPDGRRFYTREEAKRALEEIHE